MKQVKVNVGNKSYICDLLESEEDRRKGLMGVEIFLNNQQHHKTKSQPTQLRISWLFSVLNKHLINYKTMCYTSIFIDAKNTKQ